MLRDWDELPKFMKNEQVRAYYDALSRKKRSLAIKRTLDVILASTLLVFLFPLMVAIGVIVRCDSKGPALFRQVRITQYGRRYRIYKFRTMVDEPTIRGTQITIRGDKRVTKVGKRLRSLRLDELPQLLNILCGDMSFVGTRPEVEKYVRAYSPEMYATLLLPAGVTSEASVRYKDEEQLLDEADDVDVTYITEILPSKMEYNLKGVKRFSLWSDLAVMFKTVFAVVRVRPQT